LQDWHGRYARDSFSEEESTTTMIPPSEFASDTCGDNDPSRSGPARSEHALQLQARIEEFEERADHANWNAFAPSLIAMEADLVRLAEAAGRAVADELQNQSVNTIASSTTARDYLKVLRGLTNCANVSLDLRLAAIATTQSPGTP
jgi:hypothetical protein